jgi:hypothetical protein
VTVADPNTTTRARTARRPHLCENCHWTPSLRGVATIQPGHRYLLHTAFPDGMVNTSGRPYSLKECVACARERDDSAGLLVAKACATFCHGTLPCALPLKHDGDHSCRRCAEDRTRVLLTVVDGN